jgi:hypothetical protein
MGSRLAGWLKRRSRRKALARFVRESKPIGMHDDSPNRCDVCGVGRDPETGLLHHRRAWGFDGEERAHRQVTVASGPPVVEWLRRQRERDTDG